MLAKMRIHTESWCVCSLDGSNEIMAIVL